MKRLLLSLVLLLPLPLAADFAKPVLQGNGLCRFILHAYNLPKANEDKINFIVSDLLKQHEKAFDFTASPDLHIKIRIFGRQEDYFQFGSTNMTDQHASMSMSNLNGYFSGRDNEVVTWRQKDPSYLANNILHECSHAITSSQFRLLPVWLNEGCAVYFSFPRYMRDATDERRLASFWLRMKKYLDEGSLPDLRGFLNINNGDFRSMPTERSYPVSWSLFQFFMSSPEKRKLMNNMLQSVQTSKTRDPDYAGLLDRSYPGGLTRMHKDWYAWISRGAASLSNPKPPAR